MRTAQRDTDGDAGFSLVELIYSVIIIFIVAMGVMTALNFTAISTAGSSSRVAALNLANQRLEQARNLPYDSVGVFFADGTTGDPAGTMAADEEVDGRFTVHQDVSWARDPSTGRALYKQMTVTVSWQENGGGSVDVSTNIFGKSSLVNTGDLSILVEDAVSGLRIEGARVTVTPASGTARTLDTDASGEAFLGYLPTGVYSVQVVSGDYVFDTDLLAQVNVTSDVLTQIIAYAYRASTLTVTVDDGASPISGATVAITLPSGSTVSATTDSNGRAVFTRLLTGNHAISVSASGFGPANTSIDILEPSDTYATSVTLAPRTGLTVRVVDGTQAPVRGADVTVYGPSPATGIAAGPSATLDNGEVSFDALMPGWYWVRATMPGFSTADSGWFQFYATSADPIRQLAISPAQGGSLDITTNDSSGHPGDYRIRVRDREQGIDYEQYFWTGSDGFISLTGLEPGEYEIRMYYYRNNGDRRSVEQRTTVVVGQTRSVTLQRP